MRCSGSCSRQLRLRSRFRDCETWRAAVRLLSGTNATSATDGLGSFLLCGFGDSGLLTPTSAQAPWQNGVAERIHDSLENDALNQRAMEPTLPDPECAASDAVLSREQLAEFQRSLTLLSDAGVESEHERCRREVWYDGKLIPPSNGATAISRRVARVAEVPEAAGVDTP
jgi:hypothetical protein